MESKLRVGDTIVRQEEVKYFVVEEANGKFYKKLLRDCDKKEEIKDKDDYRLIGRIVKIDKEGNFEKTNWK